MNAKELKALADKYASIADEKEEIEKLAETTRRTNPTDSAANALGQRCVNAADGDAVRAICAEVK